MRAPKTSIQLIAAAAAALLAFATTASMADCDAQSGEQMAALIELYTSEGCSSCPHADRALGELAQELDTEMQVVPLALHVTYWDELGWQDSYAQPAFDERQKWLVTANHKSIVYTPQLFVAGHEARDWQGRLGVLVRQINEFRAGGHIRVRARLHGDATLALQVEASSSSEGTPAVLYLALTESGLSSVISNGENSGRTLTHEHVVRALLGPLHLTRRGLKVNRDFALDSSWSKARLGVVAFIQSARDGRVLQALGLQHCAAS